MRRNNSFFDGRLAIGIIAGAAIVTLVYLTLSESISTLKIEATTIIALAALGISAFNFREQRILRQAATEPLVIAHLEERDDAREMLCFNLTNVGTGAALRVTYEISGLDLNNLPNKLLKQDKSTAAIALLRPGQSAQYNFELSFKAMEAGSEISPFSVFTEYYSADGEKYNSTHVVDVRQFSGQTAHKSPMMRAVTALENISKSLAKTTKS